MCQVVDVKVSNRNIKVASVKEKYIHNIIESAKGCALIDRVVLFGSSISTKCKKSSDIDIAVFGRDVPSRALQSAMFKNFANKLYQYDDYGQDYDILYFKSGSKNNSPILERINEGEVLYVRGE